ncbi:TonB-dependent siderophore receptor [Cupriavidus basilensis]
MLSRQLIAPVTLGCLLSPAMAQTATDAVATLPSVTVSAAGDPRTDTGFATRRAASVTKSGTSAADSAQSITIITRDLMDSQQAQTLGDALGNSAGVVTNVYGRRGWDDFIIRGQRASESVFVDGLLVESNNRVAQELFGAERVEVLKGPASVLFGKVQPGGMVNIVSKRPRPELFGELGLTVGNYGLRQVTADVGTPLSEKRQGRAARKCPGDEQRRPDRLRVLPQPLYRAVAVAGPWRAHRPDPAGKP